MAKVQLFLKSLDRVAGGVESVEEAEVIAMDLCLSAEKKGKDGGAGESGKKKGKTQNDAVEKALNVGDDHVESENVNEGDDTSTRKKKRKASISSHKKRKKDDGEEGGNAKQDDGSDKRSKKKRRKNSIKSGKKKNKNDSK